MKLNSYSNTKHFFCCMHIFFFNEHLADRSISKHYLKNDAASWIGGKKSSTSRTFHNYTKGFYGFSENALHKCFIMSDVMASEWKMPQLIAGIEKTKNKTKKKKKTLNTFKYEFSFKTYSYCITIAYSPAQKFWCNCMVVSHKN